MKSCDALDVVRPIFYETAETMYQDHDGSGFADMPVSSPDTFYVYIFIFMKNAFLGQVASIFKYDA